MTDTPTTYIRAPWVNNLPEKYQEEGVLQDKYNKGMDRGRKANLSGANLSGANLRDAYLRGSDLRGSDLSGANLRGVPKIKNIHQAVYAAASQPNALNMESWHECDTTHCRGGGVIDLAGDAGRAMEWCLGTPTAAAIIYMASDPELEKIPDFYASKKQVLANMKMLAELEASREEVDKVEK